MLLVDFENLPKVDLSTIPDDVIVPFFFGASQRTVSKDFLKAALKLGSRFLPIDIEGQGKNALDFHIAFYLGEHLSRDPHAHCAILSRDKGFDPLVRHLVGRKFIVRRAMSIAEAFSTQAPERARSATPHSASRTRSPARASASHSAGAPKTSTAEVDAAIDAGGVYGAVWARDLITRLNRRNRPRRRKGLVALLMSRCASQLSNDAAERVVDELIAAGVIQELGGALSFPD